MITDSEIRILILEDNSADAELVEYTLKRAGVRFVPCRVETEREYVRALAEFAPDIILSDYDLPQFNGIQALKLAKEHSPGVPFILVTGAVGEDRAIEILTGGAVDYVMKNRLSRLAPTVRRTMLAVKERKDRERAEAERDLLLQQLETRVQQRTEELQAEIAERKRVQKQLNAHLSNSPLAVVEFDPSFRVSRWSQEAERLFGWPADEVIGRAIAEMKWVHEEDLERVRQISSDMLSHRRPRNMHANRNYRKDGSIVHCEWYNSAIYDENGRMASILSSVLDVTERKRSEKALRESQRDLNRAQAVAQVGSWRFDRRRNEGQCSDETYRIFGIPLGTSMNYESFLAAVHPEDREYVDRKWEATLAGGPYDVEHRIIVGETVKWVHGWAEREFNPQGEVVGAFGIVQDITGRKQMEESLRESKRSVQNQLSEIEAYYDNAPVGLCVLDAQMRYVRVNERLAVLSGRPVAEHLGRLPCEIVPKLADRVEHLFSLVIESGEPVRNVEFSGEAGGFERKWITSYYPIKDEKGRIAYVSLVIEDITERKRAEEALRRSESLLRTIIDNSPDPIFMKDRNGRMLIANPATLAAGGKSAEEVIGKTAMEEYPDPQSGQAIMENDRRIMESGQTKTFEEIIYNPDGPHVFLSTKAPLHDSDGRIIGLIGIARDITERKQMEQELQKSRDELEIKVGERTRKLSSAIEALRAEEETRKRITEDLRQSEEAYRLLVEMNPVGVFRTLDDPATLENRRLHCNEAHLRILGYSSLQEWLNENTTKVFYSEDDLRNYRDNLFKYGKVINFKVQMKRKDGSTIWVLLNSTARKRGDKVLIEGTMTDISEQKSIEERLRYAQKKLRAMASEIVLADERSRQHFAVDLHDTVVQTLGAAKLRSQLIQDQIPQRAKPVFMEMQDLVSQSISQARTIMAEMSPPVLNELGFIPALEWLTEQIGKQHHIDISFECRTAAVPLPRDIEVLLFQATRELLMNVVKHANADKALVKVSANKQKVRIEVIDDGKGFDKRQAFRIDVSSGGYGLFSIRERIRHFGGHLVIQSETGRGTRVVMNAPTITAK